jgi:hypothetical protein
MDRDTGGNEYLFVLWEEISAKTPEDTWLTSN